MKQVYTADEVKGILMGVRQETDSKYDGVTHKHFDYSDDCRAGTEGYEFASRRFNEQVDEAIEEVGRQYSPVLQVLSPMTFTEPKVYGVWNCTGWMQRMSGDVIHSPYPQVMQIEANQINRERSGSREWPSVVVREIGADGLPVPETGEQTPLEIPDGYKLTQTERGWICQEDKPVAPFTYFAKTAEEAVDGVKEVLRIYGQAQ